MHPPNRDIPLKEDGFHQATWSPKPKESWDSHELMEVTHIFHVLSKTTNWSLLSQAEPVLVKFCCYRQCREQLQLNQWAATCIHWLGQKKLASLICIKVWMGPDQGATFHCKNNILSLLPGSILLAIKFSLIKFPVLQMNVLTHITEKNSFKGTDFLSPFL